MVGARQYNAVLMDETDKSIDRVDLRVEVVRELVQEKTVEGKGRKESI